MNKISLSISANWIKNFLSDEGLVKKAYLNSFALLLDFTARIIIALFINPYILKGVGDYLFGVWQVLSKITAYASTASGGPTQALKWTIANTQNSTDDNEKQRIVGSAVITWLVLLPLMSVMGFLIAWFAPDYLKAPLEFVGTVRLTAGLLMANIIIIGLADVPHSALRGANLDYKSIGTSTFLVIANGWTDYLAIYLRTGISGVAFTDILITIATGAFFIRIARENIAWLGIKLPIRDELRRFFSLNWWFIGWQLVVQAMLVGDVVLLGILLSPNIVTIYVITKYALDVATNLIVTAIAGILPGLGGIIGAGEVKKAAQLRGEMISLIWLLATCIGSTILLMDRSFIAIWVGKQYDAGWINLLLITIMMIQLVIIRGDASIIDVTLKLRHKVYWGIVSVTVSLMLAGFMIKYFSLGIGGLCLGFILGQSILTFAYPWLIGKELGISFVSQLKQCVRPAGVTILLFAISIYLSQFIWTDNWIMLGVSCAVTFSLAMLLAYLGGLPEYLRKNLLERFLRILPVSQ